ncbi:YopX family protein [Jeotgalibacillus haloalkalitolerans]|uniref:YopX family protein n=1 Tax=Jeotgalibacillus haloalkalitolerans TaxID=3104292 RepID=A0ABU5KLZ2_9BACL|nr:YopX family protein [Jeotgalibacillus sp. HH7-29]MDZ5712266.1 YopX family protein [Jeotgalibacillus sp. HH7-29]
MREIKYRARASHIKYARYKAWFYGAPYRDHKGKWRMRNDTHDVGIVDKSIAQFTGLIVENEKELYEGHIFHLGDPNITYTVVWHDTGLKGKQNGAASFVGLEHWQERIEIVGNRYENPELLEAKR